MAGDLSVFAVFALSPTALPGPGDMREALYNNSLSTHLTLITIIEIPENAPAKLPKMAMLLYDQVPHRTVYRDCWAAPCLARGPG